MSIHGRLLTCNITELTYSQPLCNVGYALNDDVKVVICIGCHCGVPIEMLNSHTKKHHRGRNVLSHKEQATVVDLLTNKGYRTSSVEKYFQIPGQKPVDGLEVLEGFLCPLPNDDGSNCSKAFLALSSFTRHLSDHRGSKPHPPSCASYVQTLFCQGGLQCYFSVDPSLSKLDPSTASAYAYAVKTLETLPKEEIPISEHDKDRASIHWFTRWPELLKPYTTDKTSITSLQSLVSFPDPASDPEWLTKLQDHGRRWWNKAEEAHINCSYRTSVMLRCHDQ